MALRLRSANRALMREINQSIVLGLVREHGPISRAEVARAAHLSAATVTGITTSLIAQDLLFEDVAGASTGGRRPILLSFNRAAGIALGIKITEHELVCVVTDLGGVEVERTRIALRTGATPEDAVALIAAEVSRLRRAYPRQRLVGVGLGIAGVVDRPSGVCRLSPFLRWRNVPLRMALEEAVAVPVVVDNDVNMLTSAFRAEAERPDTSSFVVVTLGRGVGLGMMLNGTPFRGDRGQGGEFGHITVLSGGPRCACGKRGCLEAVASVPALIRDASGVLRREVSEAELRRLVETGDHEVMQLVDRAAGIVGEALATLVNILSPGTLVLSGEGSWLVGHMLPRITSMLKDNVFDGLADALHVRVEDRGDEFWARGAAVVLLEDMFSPRLEREPPGHRTRVPVSASGKGRMVHGG